jgi:hypothetical protein
MFLVICKRCGRDLITAPRLRDPEIAALIEHLERCSGDKLKAAPLGEVLSHVRVVSVSE